MLTFYSIPQSFIELNIFLRINGIYLQNPIQTNDNAHKTINPAKKQLYKSDKFVFCKT